MRGRKEIHPKKRKKIMFSMDKIEHGLTSKDCDKNNKSRRRNIARVDLPAKLAIHMN
jgi:hypothetical protein